MIITYLALLLKFSISMGAACPMKEVPDDQSCTCIENNTLPELCATILSEQADLEVN